MWIPIQLQRFRLLIQGLCGFYFTGHWAAIKASWLRALVVATTLGILIPFIVKLAKPQPAQEAAMSSLVWQIPLCMFIIFVVFSLIYTPYWKYRRLEEKLALLGWLGELEKRDREAIGSGVAIVGCEVTLDMSVLVQELPSFLSLDHLLTIIIAYQNHGLASTISKS